MNKIIKIATVVILSLTLLLSAGVTAYAKDGKNNLIQCTGGGTANLPVSYLDDEGNWQEWVTNKVSFGFSAIPFGERTEIQNPFGTYSQAVKGQIHLVDHDLNWKIKGEFVSMLGFYPIELEWAAGPIFGTCIVNGEGPYNFTLNLNDWGEAGPDILDWFYLWIDGKYIVKGWIAGPNGNVQIHIK
jgi:hypothetical protein